MDHCVHSIIIIVCTIPQERVRYEDWGVGSAKTILLLIIILYIIIFVTTK